MDGICGGYNLHWAWATGTLAGKAVANKIGKQRKIDDTDLFIKASMGHKEELEEKICKQLKISHSHLKSWKILRQSIDARKKPELFFVYLIEAEVGQ